MKFHTESLIKLIIAGLVALALVGCASRADTVDPNYAAYLTAQANAQATQKPIVHFKARDGHSITIDAAEFAVYVPIDAGAKIRLAPVEKSGVEKFATLLKAGAPLVLGLGNIWKDTELSKDRTDERRYLYDTFANMDRATYYTDSFNTGNFGDGSGDNRDNDSSVTQTGNFGDGSGDNRDNDSSQTGNFGENSGDDRDNDSSQNGSFGTDIGNGPRNNDNSDDHSNPVKEPDDGDVDDGGVDPILPGPIVPGGG